MSPLAVTILITVFAAVIAGAVVAYSRQREAVPHRRWWQTQAVWVGVAAVSVMLGVFVAPRLLGFTFVLLPFLWIGRLGRRPREPRRHDPDR